MKWGCINGSFIFVFFGILFLGEILALSEQEVGIDGLRCDSCGMECSTVCGSRQFRTCCFNYIKKRGDPAMSIFPSGSSGHIPSHSRVPIGDNSSNGGGGGISFQDDRRWLPFRNGYPSTSGDIYRFEDDDRAHPSRGRLF